MKASAYIFASVFLFFVSVVSTEAQTPFDGTAVTPSVSLETSTDADVEEPSRENTEKKALWQRVCDFAGKCRDKAKGFLDKANDWLKTARKEFKKVKNIKGFFVQDHISNQEKKSLTEAARSKPGQSWPADGDIADARNAHYTNTLEELQAALAGPYNWMECDIRLEGPIRNHIPIPGDRRPITAHDKWQTNGLLFEDWIDIVLASGRGIKLDFKENAAIENTIEIMKKKNVPDSHLIMNIGVPKPDANISTELLSGEPVVDNRLSMIREAFPNCVINLSPGNDLEDGHYSGRSVQQMIRYAKAAGSPVMFPLRAENVTEEIVQALKPYGKIAIWNSISTYNPSDVEAEKRKFRSWGVDGMIDIMTDH